MQTYLRSLAALSSLFLGTLLFGAEAPKADACSACKSCCEKDAKCCEKDAKCCAKETKCTEKSGDCTKCEGDKTQKVVLTGSLLPQRVSKTGRRPDGISPVTVINRRELESTGQLTLEDALRKTGVNHY